MEALGLIGDLGLNVVDDDEIARCKKIFKFYDEDRDGKVRCPNPCLVPVSCAVRDGVCPGCGARS